MQSPVATVIIPNYNGRGFLSRLLASLRDQTEQRFETVLVDDASTDESVTYVRENWPQVQVNRNARNLGFAASCNIGLRRAVTPFVVLLNNDTHVAPAWLAEGLRPFEDPTVAAVASLILLAAPPHPIDTAGDVYSVAGGAVKRSHLASRETASSLGTDVFSACGASAFYRRTALAAVGYLDETMESYYEDVELGFRLAQSGHRCVFAERSVCYHYLSASYDPKGWRYHYNSSRNAEIVWWSHMPGRLRRRYLPAHLCFLACQAVNKLRQRCLLPYLAGKLSALARVSDIRKKRRQAKRIARVEDKRIESLLIRDWWKLHRGSLRPRAGIRGPGP